MFKFSKWLFCWMEPTTCSTKGKEDRTRFDTFDNADEVADKVLEIVDKYNHGLPEGRLFGALDFEENWIILAPDGTNVSLEDLPCFCSDEWVAGNSHPVMGNEV